MKKIIVSFGIITVLAGLGFYVSLEFRNPQTGTNGIVIESVEQKKKQSNLTSSVVGDTITVFPDTGLVDQAGNPFIFQNIPSKPALLSFIYTRCPDKQMCPLVTQKMARVQRDFNRNSDPSLHLYSITMDPEYDTKAVLRRYARDRNLSLERWDFVTGPIDTIKQLEKRFDVIVYRKNRSVKTHSMRSFLIDSDGVVREVLRGSDWNPSDVVRQFKKLST